MLVQIKGSVAVIIFMLDGDKGNVVAAVVVL
jgi:hypothetical protein